VCLFLHCVRLKHRVPAVGSESPPGQGLNQYPTESVARTVSPVEPHCGERGSLHSHSAADGDDVCATTALCDTDRARVRSVSQARVCSVVIAGCQLASVRADSQRRQ
jgi:hypothetical protein